MNKNNKLIKFLISNSMKQDCSWHCNQESLHVGTQWHRLLWQWDSSPALQSWRLLPLLLVSVVIFFTLPLYRYSFIQSVNQNLFLNLSLYLVKKEKWKEKTSKQTNNPTTQHPTHTSLCYSATMFSSFLSFSYSFFQAALPQGIVPFVFAKEYNVHPDILSTAWVFFIFLLLIIKLYIYI